MFLFFTFLIQYYYAKTTIYLEDIIKLKKYEFNKTNLTNAGICVDIKDLNIDEVSYLTFHSKDGIFRNSLKYEYINNCYSKYHYDEYNISLNTIVSYKNDSYESEFTYYYKFSKKENYIFVIYTDYNGTELTITYLGVKSSIRALTFLFIFLGFILLFLFGCFAWYRLCKKRVKNSIDKEVNFESDIKLVSL